MRQLLLVLFTVILSFFSWSLEKTNPLDQSEELGRVTWYRDYEEVLKQSKEDEKPVLILFQEVPGCMTCRNYGHNVLSNPLMIEAIENLFIPLAIYNNKGGKDKVILEQYGEPSWNNPVVRFTDNNGDDLGERIAGNYSALALAKGMKKILDNGGKNVPNYLKLLLLDLSSKGANETYIKTGYFKMFCFWSGEKYIGKLPGVLSTEAGFGNGEVVKFKYDSRLISKSDLINYGKKYELKWISKPTDYRRAENDDKYYLRNSDYRYLPLSTLQVTKVNSALGAGENPDHYLSPVQKKWLKEIRLGEQKKKVRYHLDFQTAFLELRFN